MKYTALLSQVDDQNPVASKKSSNLWFPIKWMRLSQGHYYSPIPLEVPFDRLELNIGSPGFDNVQLEHPTAYIRTQNGEGENWIEIFTLRNGELADTILRNTTVTITL
jgi:hypothetical protein